MILHRPRSKKRRVEKDTKKINAKIIITAVKKKSRRSREEITHINKGHYLNYRIKSRREMLC